MSKLYEVFMKDGSIEVINLEAINRIKSEGENLIVALGNDTVEVNAQSLMAAMRNAEMSIMAMEREAPVSDSVEEEVGE